MALRHADNFAWLTSAQLLTRVYGTVDDASGSILLGPYGRGSADGIRFSGDRLGYIQRASLTTSGSVAIVQADLRISVAPASATPLFRVCLGGTVQATLALETDRKLKVYRGDLTTALGSSSSYVVALSEWISLGLQLTIDDATGAALVHVWDAGDVAAQVVLNLTSQDTKAHASLATWDAIDLHAACAGTTDWANLIVADGSGSVNDDLFGTADVVARRPNGVGTHSDFTPNVGVTNYLVVDDLSADDDVTIAVGAAEGDIDTYHFEDTVDPSETVHGVIAVVVAKTTSEAAQIVVRENGVNTYTGGLGLTSSYLASGVTYDRTPAGLAWTPKRFNLMEFGCKVGDLIYTTAIHHSYPTGAVGISVTPNASAFTNSAWVEVHSSTPEAWAISGIAFAPASNPSGVYIQLGVGTAGNEVAIGTISGDLRTRAQTNVTYLQFPVVLNSVPSSSRLCVRFNKGDTDVTTWTFTPTYYKTSELTSVMPRTTQVPAVIGSGTGLAGSGTAWINTAWVEQTASATAAYYLAAVVVLPGGNFDNVEFEIDVGIGPIGSEVVLTTVRSNMRYTAIGQGGLYHIPLYPLVGQIPAGARVATRFRKSTTVGSSWYIELLVYPTATTLPTIVTTKPQQWAPAAATPTTLTAHATGWLSGVWVEFLPSTATPIAVVGIAARHTTTNPEIEIDVGTGAAGSEAAVATVRFQGISTSEGEGAFIPLRVAVDIPASTRVSLRTRSATSSQQVVVSLGYIANPDFNQRCAYRQQQFPPAANGVSIAGSGSAFGNSSWGELAAATAVTTDIIVTGIAIAPGVTGVDLEIELGTGAAASETAVFFQRLYVSGAGGCLHHQFPHPVFIASGSRLSMRFRKSGTSTANWIFSAAYVPI